MKRIKNKLKENERLRKEKYKHMSDKSMREAWKDVDGAWDMIAFAWTYKQKEFKNKIILAFLVLIVSMIINPVIAVWLHDFFAGLLNKLVG